LHHPPSVRGRAGDVTSSRGALAAKDITTLSRNPDPARARAEALFKKEEQRRDGEKAMAEYLAESRAMREKTARLRALRLARDAAAKEAAARRTRKQAS
jgi:hypothetical protein